jgi:hypothetical protein
MFNPYGVVIDEVLWIPPVSPEAIDIDPLRGFYFSPVRPSYMQI